PISSLRHTFFPLVVTPIPLLIPTLTLLSSHPPYSLISSPYPSTIPHPSPINLLSSPLLSPSILYPPTHLIYLTLQTTYPSTHPPSTLIPHSASLISPHPTPSQPHLTLSSWFPYFPSLLVIPDSHSSEPLYPQSPIVFPSHPPPYLILTIILTCLQVKISSLTHTYPHSYPQVIHISTFSPLTLILSVIPLKPLLSLSYCFAIILNTLYLT